MIFNYAEFCWTKGYVQTVYNAEVCVDAGPEVLKSCESRCWCLWLR
jgi:hypothetical protein